MIRITVLLMSIMLLFSNNVLGQSKKELKKQKQEEGYLEIKKMVESGQFVFEADWATAQKGQQRNINGEEYKLTIKDDHAKAYFPFYGRAYSVPHGGSGGIEFDNSEIDYEIKHNDKKNKITIEFKARHESESLDIYISIFSNGNSDVRILSSNRDSMTYRGTTKEIPPKKEE
ncbi:MAG: DUF4251 domain-containing protein [Flavobacteriaceae bacterium]|nr:DUF4251 domain-containing protein [Flavobacteriaceae bacterium]